MKRRWNFLIAISIALFFTSLVSSAPRLPRSGLVPAPQPPGLKFFVGNLHSHTTLSDGSGTPAIAYKFARERGKLDFLAISEHNHGSVTPKERTNGEVIGRDSSRYQILIDAAEEANKDDEFVAIYGQEFSTIKPSNHSNAFMANKVIKTKSGDYLTVLTNDWMQEHDVELIQFNHPWEAGVTISKLGTAGDTNYGFNKYSGSSAFKAAAEGRVALIEVFNGPGTIKPRPGKILKPKSGTAYYIAYLNMGLHIAPTGDQDNHFRNWGTMTEVRTVVLAPRLTRTEILKALKEQRVYATQDKDLRVTFTVNSAIMGSKLDKLSSGESAEIEVKVTDDDDPATTYQVDLYYDRGPGGNWAKVVNSRTINNNETATFAHKPFGGKGYYFVQVTSKSGTNKGKQAWTAPVWLEK